MRAFPTVRPDEISMATPQSPSSASVRDVFTGLVLPGLALVHVWELPHQAARHGGPAFFAAWALCLLVLGLPLLLLELMLGRRAGRSPLDGMAVLTREADAPRAWRATAWGAALAALLVASALALGGGAGVSFLVHHGAGDGLSAAAAGGVAWPLGTALVLLLAAGLALPARLTALRLAIPGLVLLGLLAAAASGVQALGAAYPVAALDLAGWREAVRLALLSLGAGLGLFWLGAAALPSGTGLARLAASLLLVQALLAGLLLLAMAPFVAAARAAGAVPGGLPVVVLMPALVLAAVAALASVLAPLRQRLVERGLTAPVAVAAAAGVVLVLAEGLLFAVGVAGLQQLLAVTAVLVLLVLLGWCLFGGWVMKISHARKALALPSEGIYNIWRVAVRIVLPLLIVWVLAGLAA
jgi:SNF family Na+-dependent transporter